MPLTLRQRLLLLTLLPSALLGIVVTAFFTMAAMQAVESEVSARGTAIVRYLAPVSEYGIIAGQLDNLQGLVQATVQQPGVKAAVIVGKQAKVLAVSGHLSLSSEQLRSTLKAPGPLSSGDHWLAYAAPVVRTLSDGDSLYDPVESIRAPRDQDVIGHVFVEFDRQDLVLRQRELLLRGVAMIVIGLMLTALVAVAIADSLSRPVMRLVNAVRAIAQGQLDTRVVHDSSAEIGELEQGFNTMAIRLEDVYTNMQARIEEATAQLAYQARHDPLTGLINRREFESRLEKMIATYRSGGGEHAVLFIDLDRFKQVNDTAGHLAGDELLQRIARLFAGRLRDQDTLARIGGDEFGILLADTLPAQAQKVAEDLCRLTASYRFTWENKVFSIGASIGQVSLDPDLDTVSEVLRAADSACYEAKAAGRNQIQRYSPTPFNERREQDTRWRARIETAIYQHAILFDVYPLHPLHPIQDNNPLSVEIRLRINDRDLAGLDQELIMDAAERYDLAAALDNSLLDTVISYLAQARKVGQPLACLVTLSSAAMRRKETAATLRSLLAQHGIDGQGLILGLSEENAVQYPAQSLELCTALKQQGCGIALREFGGWLASFNHLHALQPSYVQISPILTQDITTSHSSYTLLKAIQDITTELGIATIAGGVNTPEMGQKLAAIGLSFGQGKIYSPIEPLESWFEGVVMRKPPTGS